MSVVQTDLPEGMAVIEAQDGRWFPAFAPIGETIWVRIVADLTAGTIPPAVEMPVCPAEGYADRKKALEACRAWYEAATAPIQWASLAARTEMYPERNAWYLEEITRLTGGGIPSFSPFHGVYSTVFVEAEGGHEGNHAIIAVTGATPDEAIEALYQQISAWVYQDDMFERAS